MNPTPTPAAAAGSRLHAFDTLRAAALLAGLALHGALSWLPGAERYWIVADTPSRALALLFYLVHCCRMPVFFLLAGFFAAAGAALRHADGFDARRRYLADASYWIYLGHLPLLMALQVAAAQLAWPWWIEYPLSLALCLAVLLAAYALFVRDGWLGALLNGRRRPRRAGADTIAAVAP